MRTCIDDLAIWPLRIDGGLIHRGLTIEGGRRAATRGIETSA
jgi:hypothetical protein